MGKVVGAGTFALAFFGIGLIASAQSVSVSIGSGSGAAGGTVTLPITLTSSGGAQPEGIQWSFAYSSDVQSVSVSVGASDTNAQKSISCSGTTCIVYGMNNSVIGNGWIAIATFQLAANPVNSTIPVQITGVIGVDGAANSIPASGGSGTIVLNTIPTPTITLNGLSCSSTTFTAAGTTPCTVSVSSAAGSGGLTVPLSSNNSKLTVPASVVVASGSNSAQFTATAALVSTDQPAVVSASTGGVIKTVGLSLVAPVQLASVSCLPSSLGSNASATCTVSLNKVTPSAAVVTLNSSNTGLVTVPGTVTVAAGQSSATFSATAGTISSGQSVTIKGTFSGQNQSTTLNLTVSVQPSTLTCKSAAINAPGTTTCTVTLSAPAPTGGVTIVLASNNPALTAPTSVTVPAGQTSVTFSVTAVMTFSGTAATGASTLVNSVLLTATLNGGSKSFTLSVTDILPGQLTSLSCGSAGINAPGSTTCTVTISTAATSGGASVTLSSDNAVVKVPSSVTIASGKTTATFTATVSAVSVDQTASLRATLNSISQSFTLSVGVQAQITSFSCLTTTLASNASTACTVTLNKAAVSPAIVTLTRTNGAVKIPVNVTIPTGQSSANFAATTAVVNSTQVTLVAAFNGQTKSAMLTLTTLQLSTLSCSLTKAASFWTSACTLTLTGKAPSGGSIVSLLSSNNVITVAPNVTVQAGTSGASFSPTVASLSVIPPTVITATLYGASKTATLSGAATTTQSGSSPVTTSARAAKLTNRPGQPGAHLTGLYNAASYLPEQTCSPGSMATLVGSGFTGSEPVQAATSPWPTQLGGLRVTSNDNVDLPISAVTDTLIQFQCPGLPAQMPVSITVASSQFTDSVQFTMQEATPAVYLLDNANQGAVLIAGTNQVAMATKDAMPSRPARTGESLSIYANGLGPVQEDLPLGTPAPLDHAIQTKDQVTVVVGEVELPASFAGLAPGTTGVYQVNVQLSQNVPTGNAVPFYLKVTLSDGTVVQSNVATMAIQDLSQ